MKKVAGLFYLLPLIWVCCISGTLYAQSTKAGVGFGGGDVTFSTGIAVDKNQNIFTVGAFRGTADFDPGAAVYNLTSVGGFGYDIFISKFDANGNFVWAKSIGGKGSDDFASVATDKNGNVYVTCNAVDTIDVDPGVAVYNMHSSTMAVFLIKLNPAGDFQWAKIINGNRAMSNVQNRAMTIDISGSIFIIGHFEDSIDFDPSPASQIRGAYVGGGSIFLLKLDSAGNFVWVQSLDCTKSPIATSIAVTKSGYIYMCGGFNGTMDFNPGPGVDSFTAISFTRDLFICKFNASGNLIWARKCGGASSSTSCWGFSVQTDLKENVYAFGHFTGTCDFDPGAGAYNLDGENTLQDAFLVKLDSAGIFILAKSVGSINKLESFKAGVVDDIGNIFITGEFDGSADFDPGSGVHNVESRGNKDAFILRLDTGANFAWIKILAGIGLESGQKMCMDVNGNVYVTGLFYGADTMYINPGSIIASGGAGNKVFVVVCNAYGVGIHENPQPLPLGIYPVPNNGKFIIEPGWQVEFAEVIISDITGREVFTGKFFDVPKLEVNLEAKLGVHFGKLTSEKGTAYFKLIIE